MPETKVRSGQLGASLSSKTIDNTNTINTDLTKLAIAGGTNGQVLSTNGSGTLSFITAGGGVSDGDKGDITVSASGATWTVDNDAITYAKIQNVSAASKLLGRGDSGSGDTEEITLGTGLTMTGTTLAASGGGGGGTSQSAFKAADQTTVTSQPTYSADSDLVISVAVAGWYTIEVFIITTATTFVALGILGVSGYGKVSNSTSLGYDLSNEEVGSANQAGTNFTKINGLINCGGGENLRVGYYKQSGGNVTCLAGSYMKIVKVS
jgi:hypothetical protein